LRASEIRFQVAGKCGGGLAWSFHSRKPQDWSPQFEIGFTVSDSNLPNFLRVRAWSTLTNETGTPI
jgi:hypothetical protein